MARSMPAPDRPPICQINGRHTDRTHQRPGYARSSRSCRLRSPDTTINAEFVDGRAYSDLCGSAVIVVDYSSESSGHDQDVAVRGPGRVQRFDRRHAVRDACVVDERCVEGMGQREVSERPAVERMNGRHAARDVLAIDEQHQDVVHAVAMPPFRCRESLFTGARLDPELVDFDLPPASLIRKIAKQ